MSIVGVYHIGCCGDYRPIITEQLQLLLDCHLYTVMNRLVIFISNPEEVSFMKRFDPNSKFDIHIFPLEQRENYTINNFRNHLPKDTKYIFYFHTKGSSRSETVYSERRKILNFYILEKYKVCLQLLKRFHVVGCSLYQYPQLHFSGNFWWTTKEYLDTLSPKINNGYLTPEMFIGYTTLSRPLYCSLSQQTNNLPLEKHNRRSSYEIIKQIKTIPFQNYWNKNLIIHT